MSTVRNSPTEQTILRVEARKSFRLILWIRDFLGHPLDITGCELRMVVRKKFTDVNDGDSGNLITSDVAVLEGPGQGYAAFNIQASELDHEPGDYVYAIILIANGYSTVVVQGKMSIEGNTDFSAMNSSYTSGVDTNQLVLLLKEQTAISVYAGAALAPGTMSFTNADKAALDNISGPQGWQNLQGKPNFGSAAFVNVDDISLPIGGSKGAALVKGTDADYDTTWAQIAPVVGGTALSAVGQAAGKFPRSNGADGWDWQTVTVPVVSVNSKTGAVVLTADDIAASATRLWLTTVERAKLAAFSNTPTYTDLAGRPTLGTAAAKDLAYFLAATDMISNTILPKVTGLRGTSRGTAAPSGGVDTDQYRQYT